MHGIGDPYGVGVTGHSVNDGGVITECTLWGWLSWKDAEAKAQENGGTGKSMVSIKKYERLVLATPLKKSARGRTKHHPLPRGGLHVSFERLSTVCPVSRKGAGATTTYEQPSVFLELGFPSLP